MQETIQKRNLTVRLKFVLILVLSVFILNILSFIYLENLPPLDAFYFLVVTISTVGYGDISPDNSITKILLILLIITSFTTLASFSELALDNMIRSRLNPSYDLPEAPLVMFDHIIIGGFTAVGEKIALYLQDRQMTPIIIDEDLIAVRNARELNLVSYHADLSKSYVNTKLSLETAIGVYLFFQDDNKTMQTAIMLNRINSEIPIYVKTERHLTDTFGNAMGITRSYSSERILGSFISVITRKVTFARMPNQRTNGMEFIFHLVRAGFDFSQLNFDYYILGKVKANFSSFDPTFTDEDIAEGDVILMVIPRYDLHKVDPNLQQDFSTGDIPLEKGYNNIIIGGFSPFISEVINHFRVPIGHFAVITFEEDEARLAESKGLKTYLVRDKDKLPEIFEKYISGKDLIISFFPNLQDSLYLNVISQERKEKPTIFQIVRNEYEAELFDNIGTSGIISPDMLVARAMFLIFTAFYNLGFSSIQAENHVFEYEIRKGDNFHLKDQIQLRNMNFKCLLLRKNKDVRPKLHPNRFILEENDVAIFSKRTLV